MALPLPPVIPDHEILRLIGQGSYGEVWLARNVLGTLRAVKVVRREDFDSPRPFEREFHGIQRFEPVSRSHDGLVDILQVGRNDADGYFYYVMELADAAPLTAADSPTNAEPAAPTEPAAIDYRPLTLASLMAERGRMPANECVELFHALARALAHLHHAGLVHRDIKPANIIFVAGAAKFADIGLVCAADESGSFVGTEGFIPPEGSGRPTGDIYSLGKVLYETATGRDRKEFPALPQDFPDPAADAGLLELNAVILKACASNPATRHGSAEELAGELEQLREGRSVRALRRSQRRRELGLRWLLPAMGVAFVVILLFRNTTHGSRKPETAATNPAAAGESTAESLRHIRSLRRQATPGWRSEALEILTRAAAIKPTSELREEAILALAAIDLRPLPFDVPGSPAPLLLDLARERYVTTTPEGIILFRALLDHAELFRHETELEPVPQFLAFSTSGRWLAMTGQGGSLRFRRCDPGTGAWVWFGRQQGANHAAFNHDGTAVAYTFRSGESADRQLTVSPTGDMRQKRLLNFAGPTGAMGWSPDDARLAVLLDEPTSLTLTDTTTWESGESIRLEGKPSALAWFNDSHRLLCATRSHLSVVDAVTARVEAFAPGVSGALGVSLGKGDRLTALIGTDGTVQLWDTTVRRPLHSLSTAAEGVELSPDGHRLAAYAPGRTRVKLWEVSEPGDSIRLLPANAHSDLGKPAVLTADGATVSVEVGKHVTIKLPVPHDAQRIERSQDGRIIQVTLDGGSVQEWNLARLSEQLATLGLGW